MVLFVLRYDLGGTDCSAESYGPSEGEALADARYRQILLRRRVRRIISFVEMIA